MSHIRGAVHGEHAPQRQQIIQHSEDGLFVFAGIARAANQNDPLRKVDDDERARACAIALWLRFKGRRRQHRILWLEGSHLCGCRTNEQIADKHRLPRILHHKTHRQTIFFIRPRIHILDEQLTPPQMLHHPLIQGIELSGVERLVDVAPIHVRLTRRFAHDEFVFGRASRMHTCLDDEGPP